MTMLFKRALSDERVRRNLEAETVRRDGLIAGIRARIQAGNRNTRDADAGLRLDTGPRGLPGQKKSAVVHNRNFAIEATRRTMNSQRTANSILTVCLTSGGKFNVMRYIRRKQLKRGFGWKAWTSDVLYGQCGLFYDYRVLREPRRAAC
jgi:hypothetical protein